MSPSFYIVHGCSTQKKIFKKSFPFSIQNFVFINKLQISLMKNQFKKRKISCFLHQTYFYSGPHKWLSIHDAGHRANSKDYPLNNENWINKHWNQWQLQLSNEFGNINENEYLNLVKYKINDLNKNELKRFRNDLISFYSIKNSEITKVSNLYTLIL